MAFEQALRERISQLIDQGRKLRITDNEGNPTSHDHFNQCCAWLIASQHIIDTASGDAPNRYADVAEDTAEGEQNWRMAPRNVGYLTEILIHMAADMDAGLLGSLADRMRAETFENFLEHGQAYLDEGRIKEAGVIVGVVFEDSLRRICRKHAITERDVKLDTLISTLVKEKVITEAKAKRARVAAHVRTKATHAQWDEFTTTDVTAALASTRELIESKLAE